MPKTSLSTAAALVAHSCNPTVAAGDVKLLTTRQAAEVLSLGVVTLEKYRISGQGPAFIKLGRNVRYDIVDLNAWIRQGRRTSTAEATQ